MKEIVVLDESSNTIQWSSEYRTRGEFFKMKAFLKWACECYYGLKCVPFHHKECTENILMHFSDMLDGKMNPCLSTNDILYIKCMLMHNVYFWRLEKTNRLINFHEQLFNKEPIQKDYNNFILYTIPYKYKFLHYLFFAIVFCCVSCDVGVAVSKSFFEKGSIFDNACILNRFYWLCQIFFLRSCANSRKTCISKTRQTFILFFNFLSMHPPKTAPPTNGRIG